MSTDIYDLKAQEHDKIRTAVANDDHLTLYYMANIAHGDEDFEYAHKLLSLARKAQENAEIN